MAALAGCRRGGGKGALPNPQQGPALRDGRAAADGAHDGGVEGVVEGDEGGQRRVAVSGEHEGEGGGCVGGDGEREEGGEARGVLVDVELWLVVREVAFEAG